LVCSVSSFYASKGNYERETQNKLVVTVGLVISQTRIVVITLRMR